MAAKKKYTVVSRFMDSDKYAVDGVKQTYEKDADVSHFDAERLKSLEERGLVEVVKDDK